MNFGFTGLKNAINEKLKKNLGERDGNTGFFLFLLFSLFPVLEFIREHFSRGCLT